MNGLIESGVEARHIFSLGRVALMSGSDGISLMEHFGSLEDPRRPQGRRHNLLDIIAMTICAVVAGAEGWDGVELFARYKVHWFSRFLELPNGIPCSGAFARVFARLDPDRFRDCFAEGNGGLTRKTRIPASSGFGGRMTGQFDDTPHTARGTS